VVKKSSLRNPIQGAALVRLQHSRRDRRQERLLADAAGGEGFQHCRQAIHIDSWAQASVREVYAPPPLPKGHKFALSGPFADGREEDLSKPDVHDMVCAAHVGPVCTGHREANERGAVADPFDEPVTRHSHHPSFPYPKIKKPPPPFVNANLLGVKPWGSRISSSTPSTPGYREGADYSQPKSMHLLSIIHKNCGLKGGKCCLSSQC